MMIKIRHVIIFSFFFEKRKIRQPLVWMKMVLIHTN